MALAMAPHGVRVNAIGPGSIMTDVLAAVANDETGMKRILSRTPMMRIGDPLEVGQVTHEATGASFHYPFCQVVSETEVGCPWLEYCHAASSSSASDTNLDDTKPHLLFAV